MGWSFTRARYYKRNGEIDKKQEITLQLFLQDCYPVKICEVGSTLYVAVKRKYRGDITGLAVKTTVDHSSYLNFGMYWMDECLNPLEDKCPVSILKRLSYTEDENSNAWRERCWNNAKKKSEVK